ncbi:MAG: alpha/beta hydrolase [Alphaproteobacteria bacterium]|nr:alpha/beta hydrolase [Alphaproteobacteria bacterium]MDP6812620.1 alpha/beta hydrolase [Alphaproteobacteria bacterium]
MGKLVTLAGLLSTRLPEGLMAVWQTGRRETSGHRVMDPKAQAVGRFSLLVRVPGYIPTVPETRAQMQTIVRVLDEGPPPLARREDRTIPGPHGDIPVRIYDSVADGTDRPMLVYLHGGGWVQGDLDTHDGICGKLAAWADCLVVAVDYRLSPEHKFPVPVEDAHAAYLWLQSHAAELGGDPNRVAIGGDSAGGNLSAVVCQLTAQAGEGVPHGQVLIYPATDARLGSASHAEMREGYIIPRERVDWYMEQYLNGEQDRLDPRVSPLLTEDLSDQPPALVVTAGFDPLRDEGQQYAERLRQGGVAVTELPYDGQIHGFVSMCKAIPQGNQCIHGIAEWLRGRW